MIAWIVAAALGAGAVQVDSLQQGLVAHWPLVSGWSQSTTVASDRAGRGYHATKVGTATLTASDGVDCNGAGYYRHALTGFRNTDQSGCVAAWLNPDGTAGVNVWASTSDASTSNSIYFTTNGTTPSDKVA